MPDDHGSKPHEAATRPEQTEPDTLTLAAAPFLEDGYTLRRSTTTSLTLRRRRRFSWAACLRGLVLPYLLAYPRRGEDTVHLHIDVRGEVYRLG